MKLILMRHAKPVEKFQGRDSEKPLDDEGKKTQKEMAKYLKEHFEIDGIICSPALRAEESAKIVQENFPSIPLEKEVALGEAFDSYTILNHLKEKHFDCVMLVGHEPTLAMLASTLNEEHKPFKIDKSGVLIFEFKERADFGKGTFIKYISPEDIQ